MLEQKVHNLVTKSFRFCRRCKRKSFRILQYIMLIILFMATYSEKLNPKVVERHRVFFAIHDAIISVGILFAFACFLFACGPEDKPATFGLREICWIAGGSGLLILLATANDAWDN